jgi:hypothetical protein
MPGFLPFRPSVHGPVFWLHGAVFATLGLFAKPKP